MGAPTGVDVEAMRAENEQLRKEREELRATIEELNGRVRPSPRPARAAGRALTLSLPLCGWSAAPGARCR